MQGTQEGRVARVSIGSGSFPGCVTIREEPIRGSVAALIQAPDFRRSRRLGAAACSGPAPIARAYWAQPRAIPRWVGSGGVMPVKRTNAVTLTAMAPITEKTVCHVGDGIAIWAIPCVAL